MYNRLQSMVKTGLLCIIFSQQAQANNQTCSSAQHSPAILPAAAWSLLSGTAEQAPTYLTLTTSGVSTRYLRALHDTSMVYYSSSTRREMVSLSREAIREITANYGTYQSVRTTVMSVCSA